MADILQRDLPQSQAPHLLLTSGCHLSTQGRCLLYILLQDCSRGALHLLLVPMGRVWRCQCTGKVTIDHHRRDTCSTSLYLPLRWQRYHRVNPCCSSHHNNTDSSRFSRVNMHQPYHSRHWEFHIPQEGQRCLILAAK